MNENLNLIEILKDCPKGTKLYSTAHGEVELNEVKVNGIEYPIEVIIDIHKFDSFTADGRLLNEFNGECMLFPSQDQRDWSKFKFKKTKFDPNTLKPFDKVLVRNCNVESWRSQIFSHILEGGVQYPYSCISASYIYCIPYNDDTKYLIGTNEEAPEFYRYWED